MSSMHFQPPSQDAVKNKFITSMSMLLIVVSLYVTCYILVIIPCFDLKCYVPNLNIYLQNKEGPADLERAITKAVQHRIFRGM